jgi:hypothetical protein
VAVVCQGAIPYHGCCGNWLMLVTLIFITVPNMSHKLMPYHSTVTEVFSNCNTPWFGEIMLAVMCAFVRKFIVHHTQDTAMDYA